MCWTPIHNYQLRVILLNIKQNTAVSPRPQGSNTNNQNSFRNFTVPLSSAQEICTLKRFTFASKCIKCVWWPGSARTHWGAYSDPQTPSWIKRNGEGVRGGGVGKGGRQGREGRERKGRGSEGAGVRGGPPISEVRWCPRFSVAGSNVWNSIPVTVPDRSHHIRWQWHVHKRLLKTSA